MKFPIKLLVCSLSLFCSEFQDFQSGYTENSVSKNTTKGKQFKKFVYLLYYVLHIYLLIMLS